MFAGMREVHCSVVGGENGTTQKKTTGRQGHVESPFLTTSKAKAPAVLLMGLGVFTCMPRPRRIGGERLG